MTTGRRRVATAAMLTVAIALTSCQDDDTADVAGPTTTTEDRSGAVTVAPASSSTVAPTTTNEPATTTTTTAPRPPVAGDLGVLDAALDDDGTLGLQAALALFAAGYAPLAEVQPAPAALVDGTPVLRTLLANLDLLSAPQRLTVLAITDAPGVGLGDVPDEPRQQAALGTINLARVLFGRSLGRELRSDVEVTLAALPYTNPDGTRNFSSAGSHASALPFFGDGVSYDECRIRLNMDAPVDATLGFEDPTFLSSVAAETFHCLQYGLVGFGDDIPLWVLDGAAAFAGEDFVQGSPSAATWWSRWINEPERPLDERTYDAVGFFFLIKGRVDVYKFTDVFLSDSSAASIRRRLDPSEVFDRWGTQYATMPSWGSAYAISGFGAPVDAAAPAQSLTLAVDGPPIPASGLTASTELSATAYRFTAPGDVLVVTTDPGDRGGLRFGDGTEAVFAQATQSYCLRAGGCACPGATPEQATASDVASAEVFIGVGPSSGGGPELAARTLGQWCNEALVPAPPADAADSCLAHPWVSTGYVAPATPGIRKEATGGQGAVLDLRPDRTVSVSMNGTSPVVIATQGPDGVTTTTTLQYAGNGTGTWSADGGVIDVAGVDTSSFTVRVRVESSDGGQLSDIELPATDTRLSRFAGLLGTGRYECSPVSMTLTHVTPGIGGEAGFTFTR